MLRERRPPGRWLLSLAAAALVVVGAGAWAPAGAQGTIAACPTQGLTLAAVEITSPKADSTITAGAQRVTGRVFEGLTRVELYVDGVLADARSIPQGQETFDLGWQATASIPRSVTIGVVGCGSGIGQLLRASDEVRVRLTPVDTTRPTSSSTVVTPPTSAPVPTTLASTATTTAAAGAAGAAGGAASTTTTSPQATTVPPAVPATTAPPATTATRQANAPLVLSEKADEDEPGPPLWVGAVVGLSGTIGLALSAVISRRSAAKAAQGQLPVDRLDADDGSDLVSL